MSVRNILLVMPFQVSDIGGVSAAVNALAREFAAEGHRVSILVPGASSRVRPHGVTDAATVYQMYLRHPLLKGQALQSLLSFAAHFLYTLLQLRRFIAQQHIDVVLVQYPMPAKFYLGILRRWARWRLIVTYQGSDAHDLHEWNRLDRYLTGVLVKAADRIVGVSRTLLDKVVIEWPEIPRAKLHVIPNGARLQGVTGDTVPGADGLPARYALFVGHLIHRKGLDIIIRALRIAAERGQLIDLVVVGDGPDRDPFVRLADAAGVAQQVHFVGSRTPDDTLRLFGRCDFFVLGSRAEGLPLVIVEAMSCGKAVVATRIDGIPEIVEDGMTGLLVPAEDPHAMADAMVRLHTDPELTRRLGAGGRQRMLAGFSWRAVADQYRRLFDPLGASKQQAPDSALAHLLV